MADLNRYLNEHNRKDDFESRLARLLEQDFTLHRAVSPLMRRILAGHVAQ
jgi:hypothetical protein